jgi:hypothetical protein
MNEGSPASARAISQRRPLAAGERDGRSLAEALDVELVQERVELALPLPPARLHDLEHGADVVLDVQAPEDRGFLGQVADAEAGATVHGQVGDGVPVERDHAPVGRDEAGDHVEDRGLAGAVRP